MVFKEDCPVASECTLLQSQNISAERTLRIQYLHLLINGETEVQVRKLKVIQQSEW